MADPRCTNSGRPARTAGPDSPVPDAAKRPDGQHVDHWVLCDAERAKGFVRPVRLSYRHVGPPAPVYPLRPLTAEEVERYQAFGYIRFEAYPARDNASITGRYWTQPQLDAVGRGCGVVTSMPLRIAETYARDPHFYGQTFCCGCGRYLLVGECGEFVWDGTDERVGT